jgi:nucleolar protein 15
LIMSKIVHRNLQAKISALDGKFKSRRPDRSKVGKLRKHHLLACHLHAFPFYPGPEWESSDEEEPEVTVRSSSKAKKSKSTKSKTSEVKLVEKEDDESSANNVVYIGHLPNEMEEQDLGRFLEQFGDIDRLRIARSVKTGGAKGYAFVKFEEDSVAKIVAETLNGYFLGNRRLVCHLNPNPHEHLFFSSQKAIAKKKQRELLANRQRERNLSSVSKMKQITSRLLSRERKKRAKLQELGLDYDFPGYEGSSKPSEESQVASKKSKRKDSVSSETSSSSDKKKSKRKDSISSETSETKNSRKRKDSIGSIHSEGSTGSKKRRKRKESEDLSSPKGNTIVLEESKSEKKAQKKNKKGKRRESAP